MLKDQVDEFKSDLPKSDMDVGPEVNPTNQQPISTSKQGTTDVKDIKYYKPRLTKSIEEVEVEISKKVIKYVTIEDKLCCNVSQNPVFPTDCELVQLAYMAYHDEQNQQDLPSGWQLLTAASNSALNNGYYGCAYFNEEHQQIVIAHRGTNSLKDVWNDLKGIVYSKSVAQINAATTFTDMILGLVNKFNENGAYLKLSFTGHSLGAWLAQITTFTSKYLTRDENISDKFSLIRESQIGYHAHSVVFDSPGCKQMLKRLKSRYISHRYGAVNVIQISITSLDITTYLSAPNRINCCNEHVGKIYTVFVNLCDQNTVEDGNLVWRILNYPRKVLNVMHDFLTKEIRHTLDTHSIERIVNCFDPQTGLVKRDKDGKLTVQEVLNWPIIEGLNISGSREYKKVIDWISQCNNYLTPVDKSYSGNAKIRYHTKDVDENIFHLSVLNETEIYFVKGYQIRRFFPKYDSVIYSVDTDDDKTVLKFAFQKLNSMKFKIEIDKQLKFSQRDFKSSSAVELISFVKRLNHFFPQINQVKQMIRSIKDLTFDLMSKIYENKSVEYLFPIRKNSLEFDEFSFNLSPFLNNENSQVLLQVEKDTSVGVLKIYKIFESIKSETRYDNGKSMFLDVKSILQLDLLSFASFLHQIREDFLIVIENNVNSKESFDLLKEIFQKVKGNQKTKVILIVDREPEVDWVEIVEEHETSPHEGIRLGDLSSDTREDILQRELINLQGSHVSLSQIFLVSDTLKTVNDLIKFSENDDLLKSIMSTEVLMRLGHQEEIKAGSELPQLGDIEDYYIERTLTKPVQLIDPRTLKDAQKDIYAICNTNVEEFHSDTQILDKNLISHYDNWVLKRNSVNIKFIILDVVEAKKQFNKICEFYPNTNIHFVNKVGKHPNAYPEFQLNDEQIVWYTHEQVKKGSDDPDVLRLINGHVAYKEYTKISGNSDVLSIDDIRDSVVTVKGLPGMGKSTFFTHLAIQKKKLYPFMWVVNLKLPTIKWENLVKLKRPFQKVKVMEILVQILNFNSEFEKNLFEYCLFNEKVVLILDVFDEVCLKYEREIFGLWETLQNEMKVKQLWLSTRPYALKDERSMGAIYTLQGFKLEDQSRFLFRFWTKQLISNMTSDRCRDFSQRLAKVLQDDINEHSRSLITEIPLTLIVLAEYYQEQLKSFCKKRINMELQPIAIHKLLESMIDKKINLLFAEKLATDTAKQVTEIELKKRRRTTIDDHKLMALVSCHLRHLVTEQSSKIDDLIEEITNGEEITGFISGVENGAPQFIHATFAEYFAALWLIDQMVVTDDKGRFMQFLKGLGELFRRGSDVVYSLFNSRLIDNKVLDEKLTKCLQENADLVECLIVLSDTTYLNIIRFTINLEIDCCKVYNNSHPLAALIEVDDRDRFEQICDYIFGSKSDLTSIILKNHLLHLAASTNSKCDLISFLLSKVKQEHLQDVLNDVSDGCTPLHVASENSQLEVAKVLIECGADVSLRDENGFTALDLAVKNQNVEMVELLQYH